MNNSLSEDSTNKIVTEFGKDTEAFQLFAESSTSPRPAALLFHGLTGTPKEMRELASHLHSRGFDVSVPRLSGHASSIEELRRLPAESWIADATKALLDLRTRKPSAIVIVGLSFGSILGLYLATRSREEVKALVMLSPPTMLRSLKKRFLLSLFSYLPDSMLNRLGLVVKGPRPEGIFRTPRVAYTSHSISALARIFYIYRLARQQTSALRCPVLAIQDPNEHYLLATATQKLQQQLPNSEFTQRWVPGGEHELTIGPRSEEVEQIVSDFLISHLEMQ